MDLRVGSSSFLQWHAEELSANNHKALLIPEGFAHGFQALTDDCKLLYIHSASYAQYAESALNALDSTLAIDWPFEVTEISEGDHNHSMLDSKFKGIVLS